MKKVAEICMQWWRKRSTGQRTLLISGGVMVLLLCCSYSAFRFGNVHYLEQNQKLENADKRLAELYRTIDKQTSRINQLSVELEMEKMAAQSLQQDLASQNSELFDLKKELGIYQQVMAPDLLDEGLAVFSWKGSPTAQSNKVAYQFILYQATARKQSIKGQVAVTFTGKNGAGEPVTFSLNQLTAGTAEEKFSFIYFQEFSGELTIPDGVVVEQVRIEATANKGKKTAQTVVKTFDFISG